MDMTPEQWREIEGLVDSALQRPGSERARFLIDRCAGDEGKLEQALDLLLASGEADAIATPAWAPAGGGEREPTLPDEHDRPAPKPDGPASGVGLTVGSFLLLRQLGRGGMGTVFEGQQTSPVKRRVAVKIAHKPLGSEGRLRLAAERQAMARLSHPNVAQMLEAGSTDDGYPYFAMELVDGTPITTYCDRARLGLEQRLRLFLAVCSGVQHAHQKGILHRDLKPTNVLVAEIDGQPAAKIIDFGIAKALDEPLLDRTLDTGQRIIGTPAYLSPEALAGFGEGADTRGDVYSLGVLLQELLIGERPFPEEAGATPLSLWRRKTEEEPPSLSRRWRELDGERREQLAGDRGTEPRQLGRRIGGDLEWIVRKAVARDPAERYSGVSELAADVERHLADQPVLAGPPTAGYQLRKLMRRHRAAVVLSLLLVLALAGGLVARSLEAARANRQAAEALAARQETEKVVDFLVGLFGAVDPNQALGEESTARELLEAGAARLQGPELEAVPRVRARLFHTTAEVHWSLGDARTALPLAEQALAIRRRELGDRHPDVEDSLTLVAILESEVGNYERSEELLNQALVLSQALHGESSPQVVHVLKVLGAIHEETHRFDQALSFYDRALAITENAGRADSIDAADLLNNMGVVHWRRDDYDQAEAVYRRALEIKDKLLEPDHPSVAMTLNNLGDVLKEIPRLEEASAILQRVYAIREKVLGAGHPHLGVTLNSMGDLERMRGHWDEAEALFLRARDVWRQALGAEHDWVAYADQNLGLVYGAQGRDAEAEAAYRQALAIRRAAFGDGNPIVGKTQALLGRTLRRQGRLEEAEDVLRLAEGIVETAAGAEWHYTICLTERGRIALEQGRLESARDFLERARAAAEVDDPPTSRFGSALDALARLALAEGRDAEAEELARRAVDLLEANLPAGHRQLEEARAFLARAPSGSSRNASVTGDGGIGRGGIAAVAVPNTNGDCEIDPGTAPDSIG